MTGIEAHIAKPYQLGWETDIESDKAPVGLN